MNTNNNINIDISKDKSLITCSVNDTVFKVTIGAPLHLDETGEVRSSLFTASKIRENVVKIEAKSPHVILNLESYDIHVKKEDEKLISILNDNDLISYMNNLTVRSALTNKPLEYNLSTVDNNIYIEANEEALITLDLVVISESPKHVLIKKIGDIKYWYDFQTKKITKEQDAQVTVLASNVNISYSHEAPFVLSDNYMIFKQYLYRLNEGAATKLKNVPYRHVALVDNNTFVGSYKDDSSMTWHYETFVLNEEAETLETRHKFNTLKKYFDSSYEVSPLMTYKDEDYAYYTKGCVYGYDNYISDVQKTIKIDRKTLEITAMDEMSEREVFLGFHGGRLVTMQCAEGGYPYVCIDQIDTGMQVNDIYVVLSGDEDHICFVQTSVFYNSDYIYSYMLKIKDNDFTIQSNVIDFYIAKGMAQHMDNNFGYYDALLGNKNIMQVSHNDAKITLLNKDMIDIDSSTATITDTHITIEPNASLIIKRDKIMNDSILLGLAYGAEIICNDIKISPHVAFNITSLQGDIIIKPKDEYQRYVSLYFNQTFFIEYPTKNDFIKEDLLFGLKRQVSVRDAFSATTIRSTSKHNDFSFDSKRQVSLVDIVNLDTNRQILSSGEVITHLDTNRQIVKTSNASIPLLRKTFIEDNILLDTNRHVKKESYQLFKLDTKRQVYIENDDLFKTVRHTCIPNNLSVDLYREITKDKTYYFDTKRDIKKEYMRTISLDTNRLVSLRVEHDLSTIRDVVNHYEEEVSLDTNRSVTGSYDSLFDINRKVCIRNDVTVNSLRNVSKTDIIQTSKLNRNVYKTINVDIDSSRSIMCTSPLLVPLQREVINMSDISFDAAREIFIPSLLMLDTKRDVKKEYETISLFDTSRKVYAQEEKFLDTTKNVFKEHIYIIGTQRSTSKDACINGQTKRDVLKTEKADLATTRQIIANDDKSASTLDITLELKHGTLHIVEQKFYMPRIIEVELF